MKTMLVRFSLLLSCLFLFVTAAVSDTIKLKNGSVIKGKVTVYNDREFTIMLDLGSTSKRSSSRMVIAAEDIESIQFDTGEVANGATAPATENGERLAAKEPPMRSVSTPPVAQPIAQPHAPTTFSNTPTKPANNEASVFEKTVVVAAAADWTSTEIKVKKGQRVSIAATGQVELGSNRLAGPNGIQLSDPKRLILTSPTGALIAVIGDDNDEFIHLGSQAEFVAERDGVLFLSVNEANLKDNNGSFTAKVKVVGK